jgi:hypothetical protein
MKRCACSRFRSISLGFLTFLATLHECLDRESDEPPESADASKHHDGQHEPDPAETGVTDDDCHDQVHGLHRRLRCHEIKQDREGRECYPVETAPVKSKVQVIRPAALNIAKTLGELPYFETSAKTSDGADDAFVKLCELMLTASE